MTVFSDFGEFEGNRASPSCGVDLSSCIDQEGGENLNITRGVADCGSIAISFVTFSRETVARGTTGCIVENGNLEARLCGEDMGSEPQTAPTMAPSLPASPSSLPGSTGVAPADGAPPTEDADTPEPGRQIVQVIPENLLDPEDAYCTLLELEDTQDYTPEGPACIRDLSDCKLDQNTTWIKHNINSFPETSRQFLELRPDDMFISDGKLVCSGVTIRVQTLPAGYTFSGRQLSTQDCQESPFHCDTFACSRVGGDYVASVCGAITPSGKSQDDADKGADTASELDAAKRRSPSSMMHVAMAIVAAAATAALVC